MYVCLCKGITDTQIRATVAEGACSLRDVCNTLGLASQCGKCRVLAYTIIRETQSDKNSRQQRFDAVPFQIECI